MDLSVSGYEEDGYTLPDSGLHFQRRNTWSSEYDLDRISKNIHVPRELCRIYDNTTITPDVVTRLALLENYCLYLTTEYVLYIKRFGGDIPKIVLGEVLDVCSIVGVASDEYIVIKLDGTVIFSIVQTNKDSNDMLVQNTVIFKLPYLDTQAYITRTTMLCDKEKEIFCVIASRTIYILSIDFQTLYSGGDSLLGIVSFPSPLTYTNIELPVLNDIHLESPPMDEVYNCSIWSFADNHSLVCTGNGTWLDIWPISKIDGVWELKRSHFDPIRQYTEHNCWITSMSFSNQSSYYVLGDSRGCFSFWDYNGANIAFKFIVDAPGNADHLPISAFFIDHKQDTIWYSCNIGTIMSAEVNVAKRTICHRKRVHVNALGHVTGIQWKFESTLGGDGRLRTVFDCGIAYEHIIPESVVTVLNVWPEPPHPSGHRSQVEVCTIINELSFIVVAGTSNCIFIWDLASCHLVASIPCPDRLLTSLAAFNDNTLETTKLICGHDNGKTHEFLLKLPISCRNQQPIPQLRTDSVDSFSKSLVTSIDILDVIEASVEVKLSEDIIIEREIVSESIKHAKDIPDFIHVKHDLLGTTEYCPLPVSDLHISTKGMYYSICYIRKIVVIHNCTDNKAIHQLEFDTPVKNITTIVNRDGCDSRDTLVLAIQGVGHIKVYDAIEGVFLTEFDLLAMNNDIICSSCIWENSILGSDEQQIKGIYAVHGGGLYIFGDVHGCRRIIPSTIDIKERIHLEDLVQSMSPYHTGQSPLAALWMLRKFTLIRVDLDEEVPRPSKLYEYHLRDIGSYSKVRVSMVHALDVPPRAHMHRAAVVLSDGTVMVLRLT